MSWRIVNLDYAAERPHLHLADVRRAGPGVHMRAYFDKTVEVLVGGGANIYRSPIQAIVTPEGTTVRALWFTQMLAQILDHVLVSLDVPAVQRAASMQWMTDAVAAFPDGTLLRQYPIDPPRWRGNVDASIRSLVESFGWPFELTDDALLSSMRDPALPTPRRNALFAEARRRGLLSSRDAAQAPA